MIKNRLSAIILAGGQSKRMGEDKALLDLDGQPLLQYICHCAQAVTSQVYIVTPWVERYQKIIPAECHLIPEMSLPNETPPYGPLVGLYQGLQQVETEWVLALACDLPKLNVAELEFWCEQLPKVNRDTVALVAKSQEGWEPLCGFYNRDCVDLFSVYLASGKRSFQGFLNQHSVEELKVRDRASLFNCNTPDDLAQL
ncbi:molybdenum cofactor guanylyltransferase [Euhalothece natronophila Z-M001]|uniref:Probable molybdenum cofactor guanylyltransferase n=1 Tax=Euhalothece natronophila Z-M001 TaxID=522448 RepID=A0A5B8NHA7_9CHRO|nr:molybdenum cofactor guanylyltransferase [Euhalothece natronophila]QDZ38573.1 molybdenum cofactor guanylyltransferase [Euhalothece natronophila Z-M001]